MTTTSTSLTTAAGTVTAATTPAAATAVRKLVVVTAGLGRPSSTRLLADRLADATRRHLTRGSDSRVGDVQGSDARESDARVGDVRQGELVTEVIELRELANDVARNMVTGFPGPALRDAIDAVTSADGLIAVTPVFTGSYSGLFKSFFDVVDKDALGGTPVLIAATGGTARHSLVLEHAMRPLFAYLRSVVVPTAVYAASEDWGTGGDDPLAGRIDRAAAELAALMGARSPVRVTGGSGDREEVVPFAQQLAALGAEG
ncbi:FMN reductase [Streptomyces sp. HPF1205]|uniref:FMN reductase n=1 Tax=Streptomyces sp. HPF1205 TaxID=2873262 RepID=UPI001CECAF11|nr:FMN reductase [Streptomyces sp. HPF1205]